MAHDGSEGRADERLDAEGEVAAARLALAEGDLRHAARRLADAMAADPRLPDVHEALAELVARAGGPVRALRHFEPGPERASTGTIAAHAHVCAMAGRWDRAVPELFAVAAREPHRPWLDVAWLHRPDLPDLLDPNAAAIAAARCAQPLADPVGEAERAPLLPALAVLRGCVARHPEHAMLLWCGSTLARRLGAADEAIAWAQRSFDVEPTHEAAVAKGHALRTAGRTEEALAVWRREAARTPEGHDLFLHIADLLEATGRPAEGLEWALRVVDANPEHPKALATALGLRHALDDDVRHLVALADHLRDHPEHSYAADVLARRARGRPWLGGVPEAADDLVGLLRDVLQEYGPSADVEPEVTLATPAPPSAVLALRLAFPLAEVAVDHVPEPDPRRPVGDVRHVVWAYDGTTARPAVPPPSPEAVKAVPAVAATSWPSLPAAYDRAVVLSALDPHDLLGVLVHPPAPTGDVVRHAPQRWLRGVQVWACLGLAHHRADEPWPASRRRGLLADLLNGPEDWVAEAAGLALVATAWVEPATRPDVAELVVHRMRAAVRARRTREVPVLASLCELVLALPEVDDGSAALARDVLAGGAD
ncbi:tetratricopeptide repeat protein [Actinosynnema sp. NPDC059335]|uniref:tetratricopeptide repeat protein n=1 Tax=Actinosynnema sp. NPDC059335 TaxID=3346804 RepID=UPI00366F6431